MAAVRTTGLASTRSGTRGSAASLMRRAKSAHITIEAQMSAANQNEPLPMAAPSPLSASMSKVVASAMRIAPRMSSRCGRSWRGSLRNSLFVMAKARRPSGTLIQKIADQWKFCARKPPR